MNTARLILTALGSVLALFAVTKLMGHKQVAQLDFFDYVSGITIGSIGAEMATELEEPEKPLIALGIYGLVSIFLSIVTRKFPRTRKYVNGTPTVLINDGKIYRKNLKAAKLDLSELLLLCREAGYFNLDEIQCAIFEHNGRLSVMPKAAYRPLTPMDMKIPTNGGDIGTEVIMDGRIIDQNLKRVGRDVTWLSRNLKTYGYTDAEEILLAIYRQKENTLSLYPKDVGEE